MLVILKIESGASGGKSGIPRCLIAQEEEGFQGLPVNYTAAVKNSYEDPINIESARKSLLGISWHLGVAKVCIMALLCMSHLAPTNSEPAPTGNMEINFVEQTLGKEQVQAYNKMLSDSQLLFQKARSMCPFSN